MRWQDILNRRLAKRNVEFEPTKPTQIHKDNLKRAFDDVYTAINKVKDTSSAMVMREDFRQAGGDSGHLRVIAGSRVPEKDANGVITDSNKSKRKVKLAVRDRENSVFEVELLAREEGK